MLDHASQSSPRVSRLRWWMSFGVLLVVVIVAAAFLGGHFQAYEVTSGSMKPTLEVGDRLLVDARRPVVARRGDIVALVNPQRGSEQLCKRVVAEPLDTVAFRDGILHVNNDPQTDENYVTTRRIRGLPSKRPVRLGLEEYYVLGDNRELSLDSLSFGPVPSENLIGVARWVYWPLWRAKRLKNPVSSRPRS